VGKDAGCCALAWCLSHPWQVVNILFGASTRTCVIAAVHLLTAADIISAVHDGQVAATADVHVGGAESASESRGSVLMALIHTIGHERLLDICDLYQSLHLEFATPPVAHSSEHVHFIYAYYHSCPGINAMYYCCCALINPQP
jgi:hypothetical protein